MCRFNLSNHDGVIADCEACLAFDPKSLKAHYYKAKSLLELGTDHDAACASALHAYEVCRTNDSKSLEMAMELVLRCRSERWKVREKHRRREAQDLEREVMALLERERDREVDETGDDVEKGIVREDGERRVEAMRAIFERARKEDDRERKVPDWLIDDISFNVMVDPVTVSPAVARLRWDVADEISRRTPDDRTSAHRYRQPLTAMPSTPSLVGH